MNDTIKFPRVIFFGENRKSIYSVGLVLAVILITLLATYLSIIDNQQK